MSADLIRTFDFQGRTLTFTEVAGEFWLSGSDVARALGYGSHREVTKLFARHEAEFKAGEAEVVKLTTSDGKSRRMSAFSPRGLLRLAIHADTPTAAAFRDFVIDVMDKLRRGDARLVSAEQVERLEVALRDAHAQHLADLKRVTQQLLESNATMASALGSALAARRFQKAKERALQAELDIGQRFFPGVDTRRDDGGSIGPVAGRN